MPRFLIQSMVIVFLLWAMVQCVSTRPSARLPITENYGEPKGPLYQMAETFDKLTNGQLKEEEIQSLTQTCESGSQKNPFCFSILNFSKFSPPRAPKTQEPKIAKTIRVSVQNSKIVNWKDLREAPIARLLKG